MTIKATNRPQRTENVRVPVFEGRRDALSVHGRDKDFEYRVVNDTGDRIQLFQKAGYELVESGDGTLSAGEASTMGTVQARPVGKETTGYLMRIKKEWFDEDQAKKAKLIDDEERLAILGDEVDGKYGKVQLSRIKE